MAIPPSHAHGQAAQGHINVRPPTMGMYQSRHVPVQVQAQFPKPGVGVATKLVPYHGQQAQQLVATPQMMQSVFQTPHGHTFVHPGGLGQVGMCFFSWHFNLFSQNVNVL